MGRSKAAHALRYAEDLPLGQVLIPTHKDGIWYNYLVLLKCFEYIVTNNLFTQ
ncbi:MAG: hypothetical protein HON23_06965 [Rickettsiales bacterium]|nr:hypothetical protein [Rickettsiales bacterium]